MHMCLCAASNHWRFASHAQTPTSVSYLSTCAREQYQWDANLVLWLSIHCSLSSQFIACWKFVSAAHKCVLLVILTFVILLKLMLWSTSTSLRQSIETNQTQQPIILVQFREQRQFNEWMDEAHFEKKIGTSSRYISIVLVICSVQMLLCLWSPYTDSHFCLLVLVGRWSSSFEGWWNMINRNTEGCDS